MLFLDLITTEHPQFLFWRLPAKAKGRGSPWVDLPWTQQRHHRSGARPERRSCDTPEVEHHARASGPPPRARQLRLATATTADGLESRDHHQNHQEDQNDFPPSPAASDTAAGPLAPREGRRRLTTEARPISQPRTTGTGSRCAAA